ncbi:MAG: lipoyl synthase [Gammaproteobacteria bacterium]|nr:lipoyl synthase [Gammaproteobacteria bacterium]
MQKLDIPVIVEKLEKTAEKINSGEKYKTKQGVSAIKDGIKHNQNDKTTLRKPDWLRIKIQHDPKFEEVQKLVKSNELSTVCEEAKCPNMAECWSHGTATFMLMGAVCTRACKFCSVDTGNPKGWLDLEEPIKVANSAKIMGLKYAVLTSVDRDDLPDGGAEHFAKTIRAIKALDINLKVEALTSDFQGDTNCVKTIIDSGVDVFAQNVETVERLTHPVRDNRAGYWQTINLLSYAKTYKSDLITKTSLMLGLGETDEEINQTMDDLIKNRVDVLTLGQYLQPTKNHYPIHKYVTPEDFAKYRRWGLAKGFLEVASGPLVRSSYRADKIFTTDNLGL